jgi:hypothetical protein
MLILLSDRFEDKFKEEPDLGLLRRLIFFIKIVLFFLQDINPVKFESVLTKLTQLLKIQLSQTSFFILILICNEFYVRKNDVTCIY